MARSARAIFIKTVFVAITRSRACQCSTFAGAGDERFRSFAAQRPAVFLVHIHEGLRQPARQTGMQLHTGTYARLLATASPLPSLRFLRQWYSLREEMRG
jgi:hypothetical protein